MKKYLLVMAMLMLSSCVTLPDYARQYFTQKNLPRGVTSFLQLEHGGGKSTLYARECVLLRNQLFVASLNASHHMAFLWGFPLLWPVHVVSFLSVPLVEQGRARAVWDAAMQLEQAYQTSDDAFLSQCRLLRDTELGQIFIREQPAQKA